MQGHGNLSNLDPKYASLDPKLVGVLVKVQAFIRSFLCRKEYTELKMMRNKYIKFTKYFSQYEVQETISKKRFNPNDFKEHTYTYRKTGAVYDGQWIGGLRHGQGKMLWKDGASYSGNWVYGYAEGKGTFIDCLGNTYNGDFYMNMAHGNGTYTNTEGSTYKGQWQFDRQHGQGYEKLSEKLDSYTQISKYKGEF